MERNMVLLKDTTNRHPQRDLASNIMKEWSRTLCYVSVITFKIVGMSSNLQWNFHTTPLFHMVLACPSSSSMFDDFLNLHINYQIYKNSRTKLERFYVN